MKDPKDMTRDELADALYDVYVLRKVGFYALEIVIESMHRLRNSIDRPKVEVKRDESHGWYVAINDETYWHEDEDAAVYLCDLIRLALGMEGGEG